MMFWKVVQQKLVAISSGKVSRRKAGKGSSLNSFGYRAIRASILGLTALLLGCLVPGITAFAGPVTFTSGTVNVTGTSTTAVSDAEVLTLGTTSFAYNFYGVSPVVVNGVSFTSITTNTGAGNLSISGTLTPIYFNGYYQAGAIDLLSAGYQNLLKGGVYTDPTASMQITLNGLTVGKTYFVQMWVNESRNNWTGSVDRSEDVIGGNTVRIEYNVSNLGGGVGQYVLGAFVATTTSQSFTLTAPAGLVSPCAQINAIQVRDVTDLIGVWTGAVNGSWDLATANWSGTSKFSVFSPMLSGIALKFGDQNGSGQTVTNTAVTVQSAGMAVAGSVAFTAGTLNYSLLSAGGTLGINGTGSLYKSGASTLTLAGTHTFTGGVNVAAGTLKTASFGALPNGPVTVASGATLNLNGYDQKIGLLTQNGVVASAGGEATLTLGSLAGASAPVFSGLVNLAFANNATSALTVSASLNPVGTLSNKGTSVSVALGTVTSVATKGAAILNGVIGANVTKIIQDSPTSPLVLNATNTSFTGPVEIRSGALVIASPTKNGITGDSTATDFAGQGLITLGTGAADAALLYAGEFGGGAGGNATIGNDITVSGSGTNIVATPNWSLIVTGTLNLNSSNVILGQSNPGNILGIYGWLQLNGGVTGTGNIVATNAAGAGNPYIEFNTLPVNHLGSLTFNNASLLGAPAGTGTGINKITGGVGANVTAIVQDSDSNPLTISAGSISVNPNGLNISSTGAALLTVSSPTTGTGALTINLNSTGAMSFSGALNHTGGLSVNRTGTGALTLPTATFVLPTATFGGTSTSALSIAASFSAANLSLTQSNTASALTLSGGIAVGSSGKTIVTSGSAFTISGALSGTGNTILQANSTGILTLSGGITAAIVD